ncbi:MAG TPA: PqqD family protein [Longimicrobiales bacterium]
MLRVLLDRVRRGDPEAGAKLRPARDVLTAEKDGVAVLLDLRHAVYIGLDEVGTVAWREIERGATAEALTERICEEYEAPRETVRADMQRFVADLRRKRLVVSA